MERVRSGILKILILAIINVVLLSLYLPMSKTFATSKSEFTLTTSDTRTSFNAGDTLTLNLNLVSTQYGITAISSSVLFDNSLVDVACYIPDARATQRRWESPTYSDGFMMQFAKDSSSGSTTSECIQEIELTFKRSASLSSVGLLFKDFTVVYAGLSGDDGQETSDVSYGDVSSLISDDGDERKLSLVPEEEKDSYSAGDIIVLTLYLNKTSSGITSIEGNLTYDSSLVEVNGEEDDGEYFYYIDSPGRSSSWNAITNEYDPTTKRIYITTKNNQLVSDSGPVQIIEFIVKQNTDNLSIGFENVVFSEGLDRYDAVCTPYKIGNDAEKVTVTYDYGTNGGYKDGSPTTTTETQQVSSGSAIPSPAGAKANDYTFVGWNTDPDAKAGTPITATDGLTVYAIYKKDITVTFKSCNGAVQVTQSPVVTATFYNNNLDSEPITFPLANNCTKDNKQWAHEGWTSSTSTDVSSLTLINENAVQSIKQTDTTFYMVYSTPITVKYNMNGNNDITGSAPADQTGKAYINSNVTTTVAGFKPTIATPTATRAGYDFAQTDNWNTAANGTGTKYTAGTVPTTGFTATSTTLFAQWTPKTNTPYKIKYYLQDGNNLNNYIEQTADEESKTGTTGTTATVNVTDISITDKYPGYEYDGSNSVVSGTIVATGNGLELKVYYKVKGDRSYNVERYLEDGDNPGTYTLVATDPYNNGITGKSITAPSSDYQGYTEHLEGADASGVIQANNDSSNPLILKVYYTANTDTKWYIEYYKQNWDETWPTTTDDVETRQGTTGAAIDITSETKKNIQGYTFSQTEPRNSQTGRIAGNESTRLKLYYTANDTAYKIEHYKQDAATGNFVKDDNETENLTAKTGTPITATAKQTILNSGYVEDTTNSLRKITGNVEPDGSLTLKVYYKVLLTVTLDNNDGTNTTSTFQVPYGDPYGSNLTNLTRTGYDHNTRWTTTANDSSTIVSSSTPVTTSHRLYAYWTLKKYTITYDSVGGSSVPSIEVEHGKTYSIYYADGQFPEPSKDGYYFDGWYPGVDDEGNGMGTEVQETDTITGDKTLHAKWIPKPTVYFDKNCDDDVDNFTVTSKDVVVGQAYGTLEELERKGYTFSGWADANGNIVTENTIVTDSGHHTLYAQWTARTFTIAFDKNINYSITVTPSSKTVTYDQPYGEFPDLTDVLDGYTFEGWYRGTADGQGNVTGTKVNSTDIVETPGNETLHAKWTAKPVTLIFKYREPDEQHPADNPEGVEKSVSLTFDYDTTLNTTKLRTALSQQKGINLNDITTNSNGTPKVFDTPKYTYTYTGLDLTEVSAQGNKLKNDVTTITAKYSTQIRQYDVIFYDEDKSTEVGRIQNVNYGDTADDITITKPTKAADKTYTYDWEKWKYVENNNTANFPIEVKGPTAVYAAYKATAIDYSVVFLDDDGTPIDRKDDYHYGDTIVVPASPTKAATQQYTYTFAYWEDEDGNHPQDGSGQIISTTTVDKDKTFTAVYKDNTNKYKVTFYDDAGTTVLDEDTVDYGTSAQWNRNNDKQEPTRAPSNGYTYTFANSWLQSDRQTPDDLSNVTQNRPVYPKFDAHTITYTITYRYLMGASDNPNPTTYTVEDANITLQSLDPRPGLTFVGWYADEEYLTPITTINTSEARDREIYAKWEVEDLMYFVKTSPNMDNNDPDVIVYRDFSQARDDVDILFDDGNGQALGVYDLNNDLVYFPKQLYYVKASENVDNDQAIKYSDFEEAKEYVLDQYENGTTIKIYDQKNKLVFDPSDTQTIPIDQPVVKYYVKDSEDTDNSQAIEYDDFAEAKEYVLDQYENGTTTKVYDYNNNLVFDPSDRQTVEVEVPVEIPVVKYYVKDSENIDNEDAIEFTDFYEAKDYVDGLFEEGTTTRIYDNENRLVYEPKEEVVPIEVPSVKYFVKVNSNDPDTDENTFELFSQAKRKADELVNQGVKVYDNNGEIVYIPEVTEEPEEPEDLYLRTRKYRIGENNFREYEKGDIYFYRIDPYMTLSQFIGTCITNGKITVYKQSGEKLQNDEFVGTGMILRDEKDGQYILLMLSIKGDIDGNGKITATDLAATKQQILKDVELSGAQFLADDLNIDDATTATDLAAINQAILKEIDLKRIN